MDELTLWKARAEALLAVAQAAHTLVSHAVTPYQVNGRAGVVYVSGRDLGALEEELTRLQRLAAIEQIAEIQQAARR